MSLDHEDELRKTPYSHWGISAYPMPEDTSYLMHSGNPSAGVDEALIDDVAKAVDGEYNAIRRYTRLAELAPNPQLRNIIREIRRDEKRHFRRFTTIYASWTGGKQAPLFKSPVPDNFEEGVQQSIRGELEDTEFYRRVADMTNIPFIHRSFLDASYDERRHANWFMYMESLIHPRSGETS